MMKARTQTATRNHTASQSCCNASVCNLALLFFVLLLSASYLTENVMCTAEVSHDVTAFSGSPHCLFGQLERRLYSQKISPWNVFLNVCGFSRIFFSMTTMSWRRKAEAQQCWVCCENLHLRKTTCACLTLLLNLHISAILCLVLVSLLP